MYKVTFNNKNKAFFNTLKTAVDAYFTENKLKRTGNWRLYLKTAILIPASVILYISLLVFPMHWALGLTLCALLGFAMASIGFNVMHDACHGSFSSRSWVNETWGLSNNALGGNAFLWKLKHNIIHHTYTNVDGVDDDINNMPFMRECSTQPWRPMHRYQSYYMFILYGFTAAFMYLMDYVKYFSKKVFTTPLKPMDLKEHIIFWVSKLIYVLIFIVIPISVVGWQAWLPGYFVMQFVLGFTLAIVFQLAHVVEHAEFAAAGIEPKRIEDEWAIHQVKTTANFAAKNQIVTWLVGGLNFQIEHHLFPRISHIHYPAISKIVKEICVQFNINYNYFPTMTAAVVSHYRIMKELGRRP